MNGYVFINESGEFAQEQPETELYDALIVWVKEVNEATVFSSRNPWLPDGDFRDDLIHCQTIEATSQTIIKFEKWSK